MRTPGGGSSSSSSAITAGFTVVLFAASVGITSGGAFVSLLSLTGVLAGIGLIFAGVQTPGPDPAAPLFLFPTVVGALTAASLRPNRNIAFTAGLIVASCAATAIAGEAGPLLCFLMFALLLLGLSLITIGILSE